MAGSRREGCREGGRLGMRGVPDGHSSKGWGGSGEGVTCHSEHSSQPACLRSLGDGAAAAAELHMQLWSRIRHCRGRKGGREGGYLEMS
jgi:hypothetical protein